MAPLCCKQEKGCAILNKKRRVAPENAQNEKASEKLTFGAHTVQPVIRRSRCNNVI